MVKVCFVGDAISKTNVHSDIAFIGAKCFPTLVKWIKILDPDYYIVLNSNSSKDHFKIEKLHEDGFKIITLGNKADAKIRKYTYITDAYRIEHPSGLNRNLNNKSYVDKMLKECKTYIEEI